MARTPPYGYDGFLRFLPKPGEASPRARGMAWLARARPNWRARVTRRPERDTPPPLVWFPRMRHKPRKRVWGAVGVYGGNASAQPTWGPGGVPA